MLNYLYNLKGNSTCILTDRGAWETHTRLLLSLAFSRFSLGRNATFFPTEALRDSPGNDCETEYSTIRKGIERWGGKSGELVVSYPVCSSVMFTPLAGFRMIYFFIHNQTKSHSFRDTSNLRHNRLKSSQAFTRQLMLVWLVWLSIWR